MSVELVCLLINLKDLSSLMTFYYGVSGSVRITGYCHNKGVNSNNGSIDCGN
jgi:hypothetical protein